MRKFLLGEDCELVDSLLVGLGVIGVVALNFEEVLLEDESSVGFLFGGPGDSELVLPFLEGVSLLLSRVVEDEEGDGGRAATTNSFLISNNGLCMNQ